MQKKEDKNTEDLQVNPRRSPFSKLDNKRQNLHSPDSGREEIGEGDPYDDLQEEERLESAPWEKDRSDQSERWTHE